MNNNCTGCIYYRFLSGSANDAKGCHFMLDTGEKRGCSAEQCTRRITTKQDRTKNVLELRAKGLSIAQIAKATGIPKSTVGKICKDNAAFMPETKKEPAPSANDTGSKEIIPIEIITPDKENVKDFLPECVLTAIVNAAEANADTIRKVNAKLSELDDERCKWEQSRQTAIDENKELRKFLCQNGFRDIAEVMIGDVI